jgi:hypothetical protein
MKSTYKKMIKKNNIYNYIRMSSKLTSKYMKTIQPIIELDVLSLTKLCINLNNHVASSKYSRILLDSIYHYSPKTYLGAIKLFHKILFKYTFCLRDLYFFNSSTGQTWHTNINHLSLYIMLFIHPTLQTTSHKLYFSMEKSHNRVLKYQVLEQLYKLAENTPYIRPDIYSLPNETVETDENDESDVESKSFTPKLIFTPKSSPKSTSTPKLSPKSTSTPKSLPKLTTKPKYNIPKILEPQLKEVDAILHYLDVKCPDIKQFNPLKFYTPQHKFVLAIGDIQSGKTSFAMCCMARDIVYDNVTPVLVIKGEKAQFCQWKASWQRFTNAIGEYLKHQNITQTIFFNYIYVGETSEFESNYSFILDSLYGADKCVIVLLNNSNQMGLLVDAMNEINIETIKNIDDVSDDDMSNASFNLYVDEADELCYTGGETGLKFSQEIYKHIKKNGTEYEFGCSLRKHANILIGITATGYEHLLHENSLLPENIIYLTLPENYKGIPVLKWESFKSWDKHKKENIVIRPDTKTTDFSEHDPYIQPFLTTLSNMEAYTNINGNKKSTHPIFCLYNTSHLTAVHENFVKYVHKTFPKYFATMIFNSHGTIVKHHSYINKTFTIFGNEYPATSDGSMMINLDLADVIQFVFDSKVSRILIVGGKTFSRGLNVVTRDFTGHLTHMYYLPSDVPSNIKNKKKYSTKLGSNVATKMQAMRICGKYNDNMQLTVYTTDEARQEICESYLFQREKIHMLKLSTSMDRITKERHVQEQNQRLLAVRDYIMYSATSIQKYPMIGQKGSVLSKKPYCLNMVKGEDDSKTKVKEFKKENEFAYVEKKEEEKKEKNGENIPIEEINRLHKMFVIWSNTDCRMNNFLSQLDPMKIYINYEIKALVKKAHPTMIASELYINKRNHSKGYGLILQKLSGNKSRLHPDLIKIFRKYF